MASHGASGGFWEAYNEVHQNVRPWAVLLRQQRHTSMRPMPHRMYALAGGTGPGIGLDLVRHVWPVVFPGHKLELAFDAKMPCNRDFVVVPEHLCIVSASSRDVELHLVVEETIMLLPMAR